MADVVANPVLYGYLHRAADNITPEQDLVDNALIEEIPNENGVPVRTFVDQRSGALKFWHGVQAIFVDIKFIFEMVIECIKDLFRPATEKDLYIDVTQPPAEVEDDAHHVFVIPGLGDPGIWGHLLKGRFAAEDNVAVRVIKNQKNGNQELDTTYQPILRLIEAYCTANPGKPIVLAGVSLGGRLAHKIEVALRASHPNTSVQVYAMAPAFASQFATDMKEHVPDLANKVVDPDLLDRFEVRSEQTRELIEAENAASTPQRVIIDVQSSNDDLINDSNAFPLLEGNGDLEHIKKVAYGCSHLGVLEKCMGDIVRTTLQYFNAVQSI